MFLTNMESIPSICNFV